MVSQQQATFLEKYIKEYNNLLDEALPLLDQSVQMEEDAKFQILENRLKKTSKVFAKISKIIQANEALLKIKTIEQGLTAGLKKCTIVQQAVTQKMTKLKELELVTTTNRKVIQKFKTGESTDLSFIKRSI